MIVFNNRLVKQQDILMFCGYSMAKIIGEVIIRGQAQIAEPILVIENNPSIDITETKKYGE